MPFICFDIKSIQTIQIFSNLELQCPIQNSYSDLIHTKHVLLIKIYSRGIILKTMKINRYFYQKPHIQFKMFTNKTALTILIILLSTVKGNHSRKLFLPIVQLKIKDILQPEHRFHPCKYFF